MIRRINYFSASSYGKSTQAMKLTATLNEMGFNAAYVTEYCKDLVLRGYRQPEPIDQLHICAGQLEKELTALRNYPLIVTDSPVRLASIYCEYYGGDKLLMGIINDMSYVLDRDYPTLNVLLEKPDWNYAQDATRWQSEQEAEVVQNKIISYLNHNKIPYINGSIHSIIDEVKKSQDLTKRNLPHTI